MKAAIIDMGTNTFHLLIAEWTQSNYQILSRDRIPVRVGVGGINQNIITAEGMERAVKALIQFKNKIDEFEIFKVFAFGTSALRNSTNADEIISKIKDATGIETKIISGEDEAQFIYEGVNLALKLEEEKSLIIDIGGGSVEFIIGNGEKVFWKRSFEIGAQRLLERFHKHDPILPSEVEAVIEYYRASLPPLFDAMRIHSPNILAGSSGTFDTLSEIYCGQSGIQTTDTSETPFAIESFPKIYSEIISRSRADRMKIPGMIEMRVDMIVVACCLIKFVLDNFAFKQIRVSSYSLKEGVLASLLKGKLTI
jgi:exopolyphosphatase/guanosine-5'-triphosphate,3'-diphosphate pyrophosphatase